MKRIWYHDFKEFFLVFSILEIYNSRYILLISNCKSVMIDVNEEIYFNFSE